MRSIPPDAELTLVASQRGPVIEQNLRCLPHRLLSKLLLLESSDHYRLLSSACLSFLPSCSYPGPYLSRVSKRTRLRTPEVRLSHEELRFKSSPSQGPLLCTLDHPRIVLVMFYSLLCNELDRTLRDQVHKNEARNAASQIAPHLHTIFGLLMWYYVASFEHIIDRMKRCLLKTTPAWPP